MDQTSVDSFLSEMRSAGQVDSSGNFSLDMERTLDKLSQFQLPSPHYYVRSLLASAVSAGASYVRVYSDADDTVLEFDGRPYPPEELKDIFGSLFDTRVDPRRRPVRELAVGLQGIRNLRIDWALVDSWGEQDTGTRLHLSERFLEVRPLRDRPWKDRPDQVNRIHVREKVRARALLKYFTNLFCVGGTPETRHLAECAAFSPVPVFLNGVRLDHGFHRGEFQDIVHFYPRSPTFPIVPQLLKDLPPNHRAECPNFFAFLARTPDSHPVRFVVDGVLFSDFLPGFDNLCAVVYAPHLVKDLSQQGLVRNPAFDEVLSYLQAR